MNIESLNLIKKYMEKRHKKLLANNPRTEFVKFYTEYSEKLKYNAQDKIINMISSRLLERESIKQKFKGYYSFDNNIGGVTELREIHEQLLKERKNLQPREVSNRIVAEDTRIDFYYYDFLLDIVLSSSYPIIKIDSEKDYESLLNSFEKGDMGNNYFRGQSNAKWNIVPSFLRGVDQSKTKVIKYSDVIKRYDQIDVIDKYEKVISNKYLPYELLSFFQHSISQSPLVDFTSNFIVASYFALNNYVQINDFYNNDSAIFVLRNGKDKFKLKEITDDDLRNLKIGIYKQGYRTFEDYKTIFIEMGRLSGTNADTFFSDKVTNDRMRYQSGSFIYFNNIIINDVNNTNITINTGHQITKLVISKNIKRAILKSLKEKHPEFSIKYLMNPYDYFNDWLKVN